MLKFPPKLGKNVELSYVNTCVTKYIACHVFQFMETSAQDTLLGTYTDAHGNIRNVVACGDFVEDYKTLVEFAHLKNICLDSDPEGCNTKLSSILKAIDEQRVILPDRLRTFFWRQFIGDALLANFDRHNGNWGILVNERIRHADLAPVYDCGSCPFLQLNDKGMQRVLEKEREVEDLVKLFPKFMLMINRVRISYYDFITSTENAECDAALAGLYRHIDLDRVEGILDETPGLTPLQHRLYMTMIKARKEGILDRAFEKMEMSG